ncbi:Uncharacterized membrane protein YcaP, DUF421 family [[Clostridium] polysaccharolyticum]|uniref:Uncharacterized membrane protein YcaP, DUF421 family n=2 Tax=[Clostridium] polysaccharolyticum TaxID=29364 RepID=A0A1I0G710_9FIRM|nr:Uncharacterized membrane protein YcaP, DUF421 family [[Clostridium] polysaccharolyticum]
MDILKIIWTSLGSVIVLFILTKLMGYREVSELSMFDYINGITIGSIAAEMATNLDQFQNTLTAMIVYSIIVISISCVSNKSIKMRRFMEGKPLILMCNGKINYKSLKKARIDVDEFLCQCRNSGYFDISEIHSVILESNGKFSILPKADHRPVTPSDLHLSVAPESIQATVIIDGNIMAKNLKQTGNDLKWLHSQLKAQGVNDESEVLFATCDIYNKLSVYAKTNDEVPTDIFE